MFSESSDAYAHGVNTRGVMGAGVAKLVSRRWPDLYRAYHRECASGSLVPGGMFPYETPEGWVYNCASQNDPGPYARIEWLQNSLGLVLEHMTDHGFRTLSLPLIGGGIGGIDPKTAEDEIRVRAQLFPSLDVTLWLYP
jgi:O-acetyl-ADP-ribose deacetylase (regulator of RNase III)